LSKSWNSELETLQALEDNLEIFIDKYLYFYNYGNLKRH
jgi:hypothetical protein